MSFPYFFIFSLYCFIFPTHSICFLTSVLLKVVQVAPGVRRKCVIFLPEQVCIFMAWCLYWDLLLFSNPRLLLEIREYTPPHPSMRLNSGKFTSLPPPSEIRNPQVHPLPLVTLHWGKHHWDLEKFRPLAYILALGLGKMQSSPPMYRPWDLEKFWSLSLFRLRGLGKFWALGFGKFPSSSST